MSACVIRVCVEKLLSILGEKARRLGEHPKVVPTSSPYLYGRSQVKVLGLRASLGSP